MLRLFLLGTLGVLLECVAALAGTPRVRVVEDFAGTPHDRLRLEGGADWHRNGVTLPAGALLRLDLALGHEVEVRAAVRFPASERTHGLSVAVDGGDAVARVALEVRPGGARLIDLRPPADVADLTLFAPVAPAPTHWQIRLQLRSGVARAKAWPDGAPEPAQWMTRRYCGQPLWQAHAVVINGPAAGGGGMLTRLAVTGSAPPEPLAPLQQRDADRALELATEAQALAEGGRADRAVPLSREAVRLAEAARGPDHVLLSMALHQLGAHLNQSGARRAARVAYERALAVRQKALGPDHPALINPLHNLGRILESLGEFGAARQCYEQELALCRAGLGEEHPWTAQSLYYLAARLQTMGDYDRAAAGFREALALVRKAYGPQSSEAADMLISVAPQLAVVSRPEEGRRLAEEGVTLARKQRQAPESETARALSGLASVLLLQGQPGEALKVLDEGLEVARAAGVSRMVEAVLRQQRGGALLRLGRAAAARADLEVALGRWRQTLPDDHPEHAPILGDLGAALAAEGKHAEAWGPLLQAAALHSRMARQALATGAYREQALATRAWRSALGALLSLAELAPDGARVIELAGALLDAGAPGAAALAARQEAALTAGDPEARALADDLRAVRQLLALHLTRETERAPAGRRELEALQAREEDLERRLARQVKGYAAVTAAGRADAAAVAGRLDEGEALVTFMRYPRCEFGQQPNVRAEYYAAVVLWRGDGGRPQARLLPLGAAGPLDHAVEQWRAAVQAGAGGGRHDREVRERVWAPLEKVLPAGTRRLIVVPDGALTLLPLEAVRSEGGTYLIELYAIRYVSGGRDLIPLPRPPAAAPARAVVVADPDFGGGVGFRPLPGFAREADAAARHLRERGGWHVESLRGAAATEEALAKLSRPRLLYLITHGFFLEGERRAPGAALRDLELAAVGVRRDPDTDPRLRSGLALAGANQRKERSLKGISDGFLTALEVEGLDLWGTELVVLSACDTGRGEIQVGEGAVGLRRAFQLAGAQTVLASLWKVPDAETEQLMTDTLSRWLKGSSPAEALRESQLAMIRHLRQSGARNGKPGEAPPLYWAAFICHGR